MTTDLIQSLVMLLVGLSVLGVSISYAKVFKMQRQRMDMLQKQLDYLARRIHIHD